MAFFFWRAFALVGLCALTATSCSNAAPEASKLPKVVASETQALHPSHSVSPMNPVALRVALTARRYYQAVTAAAATGKTQHLNALALPSCPCKAVIPYIRNSYSTGSIRGFTYTLERIKPGLIKSDVAVVSVTYSVPEVRVLDREGHPTQVDAAIHHRTSALTLVPRGDRWLIARIDKL